MSTTAFTDHEISPKSLWSYMTVVFCTPTAKFSINTFSPAFEEDVQQVWDYENSVEQYQATGGTCKQSVLDQCLQLHVWIDSQ